MARSTAAVRPTKTIIGSNKDDFLEVSGSVTKVLGNGGNDVINVHATASNVTAYGGAGNDEFVSEGLNALLDGGSGADLILSAGANATLIGGLDNDIIESYGANAAIYGGKGDELIRLGSSSEFYPMPEVKNSYVSADSGNDTISTHDVSYVTIEGGEGNDVIAAYNTQYANIDGGKGNDTITLGNVWGVQVTGGAGSDIFEFYDGHDIIVKDFKSGVDKIDIGGLETYTPLSELLKDTAEGQVLSYTWTDGENSLNVFEVLFEGVHNIKASDFTSDIV